MSAHALRAHGVGRDVEDERTLLVFFNRRATDEELREVHEHLRALPVGRTPERPGDLVPLANGSSVDLGGRWSMPT